VYESGFRDRSVLLHVSILLTIHASLHPVDAACVLIAGVKSWADNPILALLARGSSKFGFNFREGF
jgi:hypothetical protein